MKTHLIFLLFALIAVAGCEGLFKIEEEPITDHITGTAINIGTGEPVPGAVIKVRMKAAETSWRWAWIDSTITDESGNFDLSYSVPDETTLLVAKGFKDGYFNLTDDIPSFRFSRDSVKVGMYPKTYLRVRIEDEYPYDYSNYVGMKLRHAGYVPWDTVRQFPLDTTIIIEADPVEYSVGYSGLAYRLIYDRPNTLGTLHYLTSVICSEFDTCDIEIRF